MKLAICGPGGSGKDAAAAFLASISVLRYRHSTSYSALPYAWEHFKHLGAGYKTAMECYQNRAKHRELWSQLIEEINKDDAAFLYKQHASHSDILTGIRKIREFKACQDAGLFQLSIWIQRNSCWTGDRKTGVIRAIDPTQEYGPELCDFIIQNNTSIDDLHQRLENFARFAGIHKELLHAGN